MAKKKSAEQTAQEDAELEAIAARFAECEKKCEECCRPAMAGAGDGDAVPQPKAIDPALVLELIQLGRLLFEWFRKRRQS